MKLAFYIMIAVIFALYGSINYYIGLRGWQAFGRCFPTGFGKGYWAVFAFLALTFLLGRIAEVYAYNSFTRALTTIGSYWLGVMVYLLLILLVIDLVRLLDHWVHFLPQNNPMLATHTGTGVVILLAGIFIYGVWNANHPRLRQYSITIPKAARETRDMRIIMASDIHLGDVVDRGRLQTMVEQINARQPDLVVLPGDTIDEDVRPYLHQNMSAVMRGIHARDGVYAVLGNHEYIGGQVALAEQAMRDSGITVLRDDVAKLPGDIYLVGRDDRSVDHRGRGPRKPLATLMQSIDRTHPIILLDHQPFNLGEAQGEGVDLQLSGHTHHGQIFPGGLITRKIYEMDWGYLRKGAYQAIVSCGYGTWGPPLRIGNTPELLEITVHFAAPTP